MRIVSISTFIILVIFLTTGCMTRDTIIGEDSDLHPFLIEIREDALFEYYYSYEMETGRFLRNDKCIAGFFHNNESVTLTRFTNLPDSGFVVTGEAELIFDIKRHYETEGMVLGLGKIGQRWDQNHATWDYAEEDYEWELDWSDYGPMTIFEEIEKVVSETDTTVIFTLPENVIQELVEGWIMEEPESFGLAIFSNRIAGLGEDHYIEFYSRETADGPRLKFDYLESIEDTTVVSYDRMPILNTFINSREPVEGYFLDEELKIANIVPTRSVIKLNLAESFFHPLPEDGDLAKITVNKAELVLFREADGEKYHFSEPLFEIFPYYLTEEYSPEDLDNLPIPVEDTGIINPSFTSVLSATADSVSVNVTSIIQSFISELEENKGIVITSSLENKDQGFTGFYTPEHPDEDKRPYLRIIYSLPITAE